MHFCPVELHSTDQLTTPMYNKNNNDKADSLIFMFKLRSDNFLVNENNDDEEETVLTVGWPSGFRHPGGAMDFLGSYRSYDKMNIQSVDLISAYFGSICICGIVIT